MGITDILNTARDAMSAQTFGLTVIDHCEELTLAHGGSMNEGLVSARLGLKGIPAEAEEIMAIRDILLARRTGGHVHLCHMSTRGSVRIPTSLSASSTAASARVKSTRSRLGIAGAS